jgi:hypothetical protein
VRAEERDLERAFTLITTWTRTISKSAQLDRALPENGWKKEARKRLEKLRDTLYGLTVVLVEVADEDDATTIFQTLNSRGKDLETADLVKAHLLQMLKSPNSVLDQARDRWDAIRESFDESAAPISTNRFLLHDWLSSEEYVGEKDLFKRIKKRVRNNNAQDYLDGLSEDAERYRAILEPSFRPWKKPQEPIATSLRAMNLFRLQQQLPFVLTILREYDSKRIKMSLVLRALQGVEHFHFLSTAVTNQPSSGGAPACTPLRRGRYSRVPHPQTRLPPLTTFLKSFVIGSPRTQNLRRPLWNCGVRASTPSRHSWSDTCLRGSTSPYPRRLRRTRSPLIS